MKKLNLSKKSIVIISVVAGVLLISGLAAGGLYYYQGNRKGEEKEEIAQAKVTNYQECKEKEGSAISGEFDQICTYENQEYSRELTEKERMQKDFTNKYTNQYYPDFELKYSGSWNISENTKPMKNSGFIERKITLEKNGAKLNITLVPYLPEVAYDKDICKDCTVDFQDYVRLKDQNNNYKYFDKKRCLHQGDLGFPEVKNGENIYCEGFGSGYLRTTLKNPNKVQWDNVGYYAVDLSGNADEETINEADYIVEGIVQSSSKNFNKEVYKTYTNQYYPNLRVVYSPDWNLEISTKPSSHSGFENRILHFSHTEKVDYEEYSEEGDTGVIISLNPYNENYAQKQIKPRFVWVNEGGFVGIGLFGDACFSSYALTEADNCSLTSSKNEYGELNYKGKCNFTGEYLEELEIDDYFIPKTTIYNQLKTTFEDQKFLGYYSINVSGCFLNNEAALALVSNSSF